MTHALTLSPQKPAPQEQAAPAVRDGLLIRLCEAGRIPDPLVRLGSRWLCWLRLREEYAGDHAAREARFWARMQQWRSGPLALATREANEQHYEVPPEFFETVLGASLKYSCALWPEGVSTLDEAETAMLALTCERAQLADGQRILELGCGWGSLSLWMAQHYPNARITAVSNSRQQREWIEGRARERGFLNLDVITADINDFATLERFDRVVSVEMFEHVRNHEELFRRIHGWLVPGGGLFTHVFCHRELTYPFESASQSDWMARHFFSGGMMPGHDLFLHYAHDLRLAQRWWIDGTHYERTSNAWLARLDASRSQVQALFDRAYPPHVAKLAVQRWRMFFIAVAALFGYDHGREWGVGHYLFER